MVRTGEPSAELISVAQEIGADAVMAGRSAKAAHLIAGSVSAKLIRCRHWPVTVVP